MRRDIFYLNKDFQKEKENFKDEIFLQRIFKRTYERVKGIQNS